MIKTHIKWTPAVGCLIAANLVPVVDVLAYEWDLVSLLFLYWLENGVIGVFTVLKMLTTYADCQGREPAVWCAWYRKTGPCRFNPVILVMVAFFLIHYGGFLLGHWSALASMLGDNWRNYMQHGREHTGLLYTLLALVLSHGFSFVRNYIGHGERKRMVVPILMFLPYRRVVGLHLIIMLLSFVFVVMEISLARTGLLLLIVVKIVADIFAHLYERDSCAAEDVQTQAYGSQRVRSTKR